MRLSSLLNRRLAQEAAGRLGGGLNNDVQVSLGFDEDDDDDLFFDGSPGGGGVGASVNYAFLDMGLGEGEGEEDADGMPIQPSMMMGGSGSGCDERLYVTQELFESMVEELTNLELAQALDAH